jgi:hypothetical protein
MPIASYLPATTISGYNSTTTPMLTATVMRTNASKVAA